MKSLVEHILQFIEKPELPSLGFLKLYPKDDKGLYILDSDGNENRLAKFSETQNLLNNNIASDAAIDESKLNLDYGTAMLKSYFDIVVSGYEETIVGDGFIDEFTVIHGMDSLYVIVDFFLLPTNERIIMDTIMIDNNRFKTTGCVLEPGEQVRVVVRK